MAAEEDGVSNGLVCVEMPSSDAKLPEEPTSETLLFELNSAILIGIARGAFRSKNHYGNQNAGYSIIYRDHITYNCGYNKIGGKQNTCNLDKNKMHMH